jgi:hypothetical protein
MSAKNSKNISLTFQEGLLKKRPKIFQTRPDLTQTNPFKQGQNQDLCYGSKLTWHSKHHLTNLEEATFLLGAKLEENFLGTKKKKKIIIIITFRGLLIKINK